MNARILIADEQEVIRRMIGLELRSVQNNKKILMAEKRNEVMKLEITMATNAYDAITYHSVGEEPYDLVIIGKMQKSKDVDLDTVDAILVMLRCRPAANILVFWTGDLVKLSDEIQKRQAENKEVCGVHVKSVDTTRVKYFDECTFRVVPNKALNEIEAMKLKKVREEKKAEASLAPPVQSPNTPLTITVDQSAKGAPTSPTDLRPLSPSELGTNHPTAFSTPGGSPPGERKAVASTQQPANNVASLSPQGQPQPDYQRSERVYAPPPGQTLVSPSSPLDRGLLADFNVKADSSALSKIGQFAPPRPGEGKQAVQPKRSRCVIL